MKKFEYREPEFKVVMTFAQDVITESEGGGGDTPTPTYQRDQWETGVIGF